MKLIFKDGIYVFVCTYDERFTPKNAGFYWDVNNKRWFTKDVNIALKLKQYADDITKEILENKVKEMNEKINNSVKAVSDIKVPAPSGKTYLPFQLAGIEYMANKDMKYVLNADDMGLGKTIQAIGLINLYNYSKTLVIVPAFLKYNWKNELERWLVNKKDIVVVNSKDIVDFTKEETVYIINYDILKNFNENILNTKFNYIIIDEAHYIKNYKAKRTELVTKIVKSCVIDKVVYLTGTPVLNRPVELFTLLSASGHPLGKNFFNYAKRYCDMKNTRYGLDVSGASNTEELSKILRSSFMVRREKTEVLKELPEKIRNLFILDVDKKIGEYVKKENEILKSIEEYRAERNKLREMGLDKEEYEEKIKKLEEKYKPTFSEISKYRRIIELSKVEKVIDMIDDIYETTSSLVIFTYHKDVAYELEKLLNEKYKVGVITGDVNAVDRQKIVDDFQSGKIDIVIGTIKACGVGITLTRSSVALFMAMDWSPSVVEQAEDRLYRIGQKNFVQIFYIVYDNSVDSYIAKQMIDKKEVIESIMDMSLYE